MLSTEHRFIVSVLDAIDPLTVDRAEGSSVSAVPFLELEHFVRVFADGAHHAKEERVLFQEMAHRGLPLHGGPLGGLLVEHDVGRSLIKRMGLAARACRAENAEAETELLESTRAYSRLMRAHIQKEDQALYPMALMLLHDEVLAQLEERFWAADATTLATFEAAAKQVVTVATQHLVAMPASAVQRPRRQSI